MNISRRQFVMDSAVSVGGLCLLGPSGLRSDDLSRVRDGCVVLELGAQCELRESFDGYRAVFGEESICVVAEPPYWPRGCQFAAVPGVSVMDERTGAALLDLLGTGATVLLESGAGFCGRAEFAAHGRALLRFFGIVVEEPVHVRSIATAPYVHYEWPTAAIVRDFSRAIPVRAENAEVIGQVGDLPVALKKRVGKGQLIFLGSPLGPALRTGDVEACEWLRKLSSTIRESV
jgi:hypothetical protein